MSARSGSKKGSSGDAITQQGRGGMSFNFAHFQRWLLLIIRLRPIASIDHTPTLSGYDETARSISEGRATPHTNTHRCCVALCRQFEVPFRACALDEQVIDIIGRKRSV